MSTNNPSARLPETVRLKRWRTRSGPVRDSYKVDGVAFIYGPAGDHEAQFDTGSARQSFRGRWPVGAHFSVRLMAHNFEERYDETLTFEVTGDPNDSDTFWTGTEGVRDGVYRRDEVKYGFCLEGATLTRRTVTEHPYPEERPVTSSMI